MKEVIIELKNNLPGINGYLKKKEEFLYVEKVINQCFSSDYFKTIESYKQFDDCHFMFQGENGLFFYVYKLDKAWKYILRLCNYNTVFYNSFFSFYEKTAQIKIPVLKKEILTFKKTSKTISCEYVNSNFSEQIFIYLEYYLIYLFKIYTSNIKHYNQILVDYRNNIELKTRHDIAFMTYHKATEDLVKSIREYEISLENELTKLTKEKSSSNIEKILMKYKNASKPVN